MAKTRTITVDTTDGAMDLFEAVPDTPNGRGLVVVQEAFGVNVHIEDVTTRFADAGYFAVSPHVFHRTGGGTVPYGEWEQVMAKFEGLTDAGILVDVDAALAHVDEAGIAATSTGIVGFCFGGRVTFLTSLRRRLGAAIGFYGGGIVTPRFPQFPPLVDETASLQTPWLGLFGAEDASIPLADLDVLRTTLDEKASVDAEVVVYDGAGHGFFRDIGHDYHPDAAADAWKRTTAWLDDHIA